VFVAPLEFVVLFFARSLWDCLSLESLSPAPEVLSVSFSPLKLFSTMSDLIKVPSDPTLMSSICDKFFCLSSFAPSHLTTISQHRVSVTSPFSSCNLHLCSFTLSCWFLYPSKYIFCRAFLIPVAFSLSHLTPPLFAVYPSPPRFISPEAPRCSPTILQVE